MKAIMQSIRPKWCELIANGKKTIEVRKTRPKTPPPFKVYMYCTKDEPLYHSGEKFYIKEAGEFGNSKVIGEYICDSIETICERKAGGRYIHKMVDRIAVEKYTAMTIDEFLNYAGLGQCFAWHISELVIYDKPKELGEFYTYCAGKGNETDKLCLNCSHLCFDNDLINGYSRWCDVYGRKPLTRAPQDWFYVEELR